MASSMPQKTEPIAGKEQDRVKTGLKVERYFTRAGISPYDEIEWEQRSASISNEKGNVVFEQSNVEIPKLGHKWPPTWWYQSIFVVHWAALRGSIACAK